MWERIQWKHIQPYISSISFTVPVALVFLDKVGCISKVEGVSMQPVLNPDVSSNDYVFINKLACRGYNFQRGEIVSLHSPKDPSKDLIKRIVALEDDIVLSRKHSTVLNRIPTGHCWVEGDNTRNSMDSNNFGPVPLGLLYAKASYIVWPPSRWQKLDTVELESDRVKHTAV